ncbi:hypothetical protein GGR58DRAFT_519150 [Xylaria digitata]|nr:hypothetical protein GGR58DRAFT_519150 [Xylaria digitata]
MELIEPYTALSYVWGDPTFVDKISLRGKELGITGNLAAALRDIRDATRAKSTPAQIILSSTSGHWNLIPNSFFGQCKKPRRREVEGEGEARSGPICDIESINSIRADYSRYRLARTSHSSNDLSSSASLISSDDARIDEKPLEGCSFRKILKVRTGCYAFDLRDAVFAHLSIVSDKDEILKFVKLDYNQMIKEQFTAAARYITKQGGLGHLTEAIAPSHPLRSILPSWVPDWRIDVSQETFLKETEAISATTFHHYAFAAPFDVKESWEILHVSGVLPLPSAYPSIFHLSCEWYHWSDDYKDARVMEDTTRHI